MPVPDPVPVLVPDPVWVNVKEGVTVIDRVAVTVGVTRLLGVTDGVRVIVPEREPVLDAVTVCDPV